MDSINISRRMLLGSGLLLAAGGAAVGLRNFWKKPLRLDAFGPLRPVSDETTGLDLIRLPDGFRYLSFGWTGDALKDGTPTPKDHDGMGVVAQHDSVLTIVRNHEISTASGPMAKLGNTYDALAGGGTTTLNFDVAEGKWLDAQASLTGTFANCAGGVTPWGSWLSCEEAVIDANGYLGPWFENRIVRLEKLHGYVFEVPADRESSAIPLRALGRFRHEAVAIDPETGIVYQTEDNRPRSGFYRFVPDKNKKLQSGRLQMMAVEGITDLRKNVPRDTWMPVDWVEIEHPALGHNPGTLDSAGVFTQGSRRGGTTFARPEGCWFSDGIVYFSDTVGGDARCGQIFAYDPKEQQITLLFESPGPKTMSHPDNITLSPNGGMIVCEDRPRPERQRLLGLTAAGQLTSVAENNMELTGEVNGLIGDYRQSEWAGACFSADGEWLFVNIQIPGTTLAINGPWSAGGL